MHPALVELENRGLINQSTNIVVLSKLLNEGKAVYCGFDPTADSLHIGSLLPLTVMKVLQSFGVEVIALVGGATGSIGDPSFKSEERTIMDWNTIDRNVSGITSVIKSILGDVKIVNNYDWSKDMSILEFLRTYGKCFTVNNMINKESVRLRIERPDQGISFTEFAYPILQGMDFEWLFEGNNCAIQLGGSDQWGNMIAGIDVIHKLHGNNAECGAITLPLLLKSDGTKFGKSETGTMWLSTNRTTPYNMYQYWLNITDDELITIYQYFKPMSLSVDDVKTEMKHNVVLFKRQFAHSMTELVHGTDKAAQAYKVSQFLFGEKIKLDIESINMMVDSGIEATVINEEVELISLLVETGLASSKKMAREFIINGAAKVNGRKINEFYDPVLNKFTEDFDIFNNNFFVLQRGRGKFVIIRMVKNTRI